MTLDLDALRWRADDHAADVAHLIAEVERLQAELDRLTTQRLGQRDPPGLGDTPE